MESLGHRLEDVERRLNDVRAGGAKDWRMAAGMFTGREFSKIVDDEGRKIREADREQARQEFGKWDGTKEDEGEQRSRNPVTLG